ncbi:MAG: hypothetical protein AcusKO_16970 [Acuticoccus sp.]
MFEFSDPHFSQVLQGGAGLENSEVVVIGLHGKGGRSEPLEERVQQALEGTDDVAYFIPESANKWWYEGEFVPADDPGIVASIDAIVRLIEALGEEGIDPSQIVLLGYSQGAGMVNEIVAATGIEFRAVVSWHGALLGPAVEAHELGLIDLEADEPFADFTVEHIPETYVGSLEGQNIYLNIHEEDPKVDVELVTASAEYYRSLGAHVNVYVEEGKSHRPTDYDIWRLGASVNYNLAAYHEAYAEDGRFSAAGLEVHRNDPTDTRIIVEMYDEKGGPVSLNNKIVINPDVPIGLVSVDLLEDGTTGVFYTESDSKLKVSAYNEAGGLMADLVMVNNCIGSSVTIDRIDDLITIGYERADGTVYEKVFGVDAKVINLTSYGTDGADFIRGSGTQDFMFGFKDDDILLGARGDDEVRGGRGNDSLDGGPGDDLLFGQGGDDVLFGGTGENRLVGHGGADDFVFRDGPSVDTIADFEIGVDRVVVESATVNEIGDVVQLGQDEYGRWHYVIGDSEVFSVNAIAESDFVFA